MLVFRSPLLIAVQLRLRKPGNKYRTYDRRYGIFNSIGLPCNVKYFNSFNESNFDISDNSARRFL